MSWPKEPTPFTIPAARAACRAGTASTLAGRADQLKERTIGAAVLGKPSDYDTGADSTVRVRELESRRATELDPIIALRES